MGAIISFMVSDVFKNINSAVLGSAYTGYVFIPQRETELYNGVKPLIDVIKKQISDMEGLSFLDSRYQNLIKDWMEENFDHLPKFKRHLDAYNKNASHLTAEQTWPQIKEMAEFDLGTQSFIP